MPPKRNRHRSQTWAWLDTLTLWLEVIGLIGTILAGVDGLVTEFGG